MQMLKQIITEIENRQNITRDQLALLLETTDTGDIAFLHERARKTADAIYGKQVFIRGLIEFTNYCKNDCIYCGIRKSNRKAERYRLTEEEILSTCALAFSGGWNGVKLYFMLGLPTETDEDVLGIADLAARVMHAWRESASNKQRGVRITVSTSWFVPKPHTAFQWEPQISKEEYQRRVKLLREAITTKTVTYNWHDPDTSFLEAVLARGDRRMCKVLEAAWRKGAKLDAWEEYFSLERWMEAFDECGLDPHFYANRQREKDEIMPWSVISSGVTEEYLWRELQRAKAGVTTPDCRTHCNACGANHLVGGTCHV